MPKADGNKKVAEEANTILSVNSASKKNQSEDSIFQPSEKFYYENFSSVPTKVGLIVDCAYKSLS